MKDNNCITRLISLIGTKHELKVKIATSELTATKNKDIKTLPKYVRYSPGANFINVHLCK